MDPSAFDTLTKAHAQQGTRRWLVRLLASLPLIGALAVVSDDAGAAERPVDRVQGRTPQRNRKQRNKNNNNQNNNQNNNNSKGSSNQQSKKCRSSADCGGRPCCSRTCCQGPANQCNPAGKCCAPNCNGKECGPDGCGNGGTCGCGAGGTCTRGTVCPSGQICTCPGGLACNPVSGQCPPPPPPPPPPRPPCTGCPVGEDCDHTDGRCECGIGSMAPNTCCRNLDGSTYGDCAGAGSATFIVAGTCAEVSSCPSGYTACVATQPLIGPDGQPTACQACCPPGTTCDPVGGFCRQCAACP
jgi:hypothetical protein